METLLENRPETSFTNKCYTCVEGKCINHKLECGKECSSCQFHRCKHIKACFPNSVVTPAKKADFRRNKSKKSKIDLSRKEVKQKEVVTEEEFTELIPGAKYKVLAGRSDEYGWICALTGDIVEAVSAYEIKCTDEERSLVHFQLTTYFDLPNLLVRVPDSTPTTAEQYGITH